MFRTDSAVVILLQMEWADRHCREQHAGDWETCKLEPCWEAREAMTRKFVWYNTATGMCGETRSMQESEAVQANLELEGISDYRWLVDDNVHRYACGCSYPTAEPTHYYDYACASCHRHNWTREL